MTLYWIYFERKLDEIFFKFLAKNQIYQGCISGSGNDKLQWLKYLHVHVITNFRLFFNSRTTIFLLVQSFFTLLSNHALLTEIIRSYVADIFIQKTYCTLITGKILLGQHGIKCLAQRHNNVRSWINSCEALNYNYYLSEFNPTTWAAKAFWKTSGKKIQKSCSPF